MSIAPTLQRYLDQNVTYGVIPHEPTMSSMRSAQICQISGDCLAKGIVLRHDGGYILAVLPASHHIRLSELRVQLGDDVHLASENEIAQREIAHIFPKIRLGRTLRSPVARGPEGVAAV